VGPDPQTSFWNQLQVSQQGKAAEKLNSRRYTEEARWEGACRVGFRFLHGFPTGRDLAKNVLPSSHREPSSIYIE